MAVTKETKTLLLKIINDMKESLSEKRFKHCVMVMKKSISLATIHGVSEDEAALARTYT